MPICEDPLPDDLIRPSRAATILKVRVRAVYHRIERGQLRAWRDSFSGQFRVSEADVRAMLTLVEARQPMPRTFTPGEVARERLRAEAREEAQMMGLLP